MVLVNIFGGLGNQMFQYATGISLAKKLNTELRFIYKINLERKDFNIDDIIHIFDVFDLKSKRMPLQEYNRQIASYPARFKNKFLKKFKFDNNSYWIQFNEKDHNYNLTFEKLEGNIFLNGYWQTEKYFNTSTLQIREEFKFKNLIKNDKIISKINSCESVSIHIRGRDYINNASSNIHNVCNSQYYLNAINFINKSVKNPIFFVVTDDINYAKSILENFSFDFNYIEESSWNKNSEIDLFYMSICKHNIIANSSFSWWGAWLNNNENKIVCTPEIWFNDSRKNSSEIIPQKWMRINCR